jgi:hypothetical protein
MQIAGNIVRPFIEAGYECNIYIDDLEGSLPESRKLFLLGLTNEQVKKHLDIRNVGITAENFFQRIQILHDDKMAHRKDYEYDTGLFNMHGERIFKLVPTIYVLDSYAMLLPKDLAEDDELGGPMSASAIAKTNTGVFKKISQLCKEANIILITVNHIMDDIQMGFIPKPAQISGLKQGERLPGGRAAIYLANNMFRVDDSTTLKPKEGFGIDGSIVNFGIVKSRTNISKRQVPLIFNKTEGSFDNILSLFQLLKAEGKISGAGVGLFFPELPSVKFSQKNFKDQLEESEELQDVFFRSAYEILKTYLSDTKIQEASKEGSTNRKLSDRFKAFATQNID